MKAESGADFHRSLLKKIQNFEFDHLAVVKSPAEQYLCHALNTVRKRKT